MLFYTVLASATISIVMVSVIHAQSVLVQSVMAQIVSLFAALSVEIQSVMEISAMVAHLSFLHHASNDVLNGAHALSVMHHINLIVNLIGPNCTVVYDPNPNTCCIMYMISKSKDILQVK